MNNEQRSEPRAAESEPTERAAFEKAIQCSSPDDNARNIKRSGDGYYIEDRIDALWDGWKMRAKLSTIEAAPDERSVHPAVTPLVASDAGLSNTADASRLPKGEQ